MNKECTPEVNVNFPLQKMEILSRNSKNFLQLLILLFPFVSNCNKISGRLIEEYQNDDYLGEYDEDNYDDDDQSEEIKESETDRTPKFISSSKHFIVNEGDSIKLPCLVDNLGKTFSFKMCC